MSEAVKSLEPLIERAEREGMWLRCTYQHLIFSPKELRAANAEGRFRWGAANWQMIDPLEIVRDAEASVVKAKENLSAVIRRYNAN